VISTANLILFSYTKCSNCRKFAVCFRLSSNVGCLRQRDSLVSILMKLQQHFHIKSTVSVRIQHTLLTVPKIWKATLHLAFLR